MDKPKIKHYYDVKVETLLPATLTYRILAETPEEAAHAIKHQQPNGVNYKLIGRRDLKLTVYNAGTTLMQLIKKLG